MSFLPLAIGILVLIAACVVYQVLPNSFDDEKNLLWFALGFLILYTIAAAYVSWAMDPFSV